ncbi:hypothetical protein Syun_001831 [Stephania yunnanensis]|uniref:Uncharacterized protein n=1 Tax=Stephania yunnanensis TaxID=152371 RepID=A0AAP0QBA3_9MAGN
MLAAQPVFPIIPVKIEKLRLEHVKLVEENDGLHLEKQKLAEEASYAKSEKLRLEHVKLVEENDGLHLEKQKLAEEASYAKIEKLRLEHVKLVEENDGLHLEKQKLAEEASYAKESMDDHVQVRSFGTVLATGEASKSFQHLLPFKD